MLQQEKRVYNQISNLWWLKGFQSPAIKKIQPQIQGLNISFGQLMAHSMSKAIGEINEPFYSIPGDPGQLIRLRKRKSE